MGRKLPEDVGQGFEPFVIDQNWSGCLEGVDVPEGGGEVEIGVRVLRNPAPGEVHVEVDMAASGPATVRVFDTAGRLVTTVFAGRLQTGVTTLTWDGPPAVARSTGSGVYFLSLVALDREETRRIVVLR